MDADDFFSTLFTDQQVMLILRGLSLEETLRICESAWDLGIDTIEIPIQDDHAVKVLATAVERGARRGRTVGAGTILTPADLAHASDAGAAFCVAPGFDPQMSEACATLSMPLIPGVATSSEIAHAMRLGHTWLKAFPAAQLGADWIAAQLAPFPGANFVATGGISGQNSQTFLAAGAKVVAVGSAASDPENLRMLAGLSEQPRTP